jgi:hypothetical protein
MGWGLTQPLFFCIIPLLLPNTMSNQVIQEIKALYGETVTSANINEYCFNNNISYQTVTKKIEPFKVSRGVWNLTIAEKLEQTYDASPSMNENLIPEVNQQYVPFGNYNDVKKIIQSKLFYPVFITGLSGNGKTQSVLQACAQLKRELIRVNITIETDQDDLLGGYRLVDGNTVWFDGPVVEAMTKGSILLLDEIDLASNKIICLQSVLEGKGVFLKKINRYVKPAPGFNVFATANTKGKGSDNGMFIFTNVLNEAFLERFPVTFEQEYPNFNIEKKILLNYMKTLDCVDDDFATKLVTWSELIRKTFFDGGCDEIISTRRLIHIIQSFAIFDNKKKAIECCVNRFDQDIKESFIDFYDKIDGGEEIVQEENNQTEE